jgi:hypothetical protein
MFENAASITSGAEASLVLGQTDFTSALSGMGAAEMMNPCHVFVDTAKNLWVCDYANHRVLKFASVSTLSNGAAASVVIGQSDFGSASGGTTSWSFRARLDSGRNRLQLFATDQKRK